MNIPTKVPNFGHSHGIWIYRGPWVTGITAQPSMNRWLNDGMFIHLHTSIPREQIHGQEPWTLTFLCMLAIYQLQNSQGYALLMPTEPPEKINPSGERITWPARYPTRMSPDGTWTQKFCTSEFCVDDPFCCYMGLRPETSGVHATLGAPWHLWIAKVRTTQWWNWFNLVFGGFSHQLCWSGSFLVRFFWQLASTIAMTYYWCYRPLYAMLLTINIHPMNHET